jgi:hypothetical protein
MTRAFAIIIALLAAAPAFAQEAANITLTLTPSEVIAIVRSMDRQPLAQTPPVGFWPVQVKIAEALAANHEAKRAFDQLLK